jgi:hypothetical protein
MKTDHEKDIEAKAKRCVKEAREMMGAGWKHIGVELRLGLAHSRVLMMVVGQCETVPDAAVRRLAEDLTHEVTRQIEGD